MKGLTRSQLHQIKESLDLATFCKKWWKVLAKEIKAADLPKFQRLQVFEKLIEGLLNESIPLCVSIADFDFIDNAIREHLNSLRMDYHE